MKNRNARESNKKITWIDWIAYNIIEKLTELERSDIDCINTLLYAVAAAMSFKEGQEFGSGPERERAKRVAEAMWKKRLERKVATLRKEADLLKACLDGKVGVEKASKFKGEMCR